MQGTRGARRHGFGTTLAAFAAVVLAASTAWSPAPRRHVEGTPVIVQARDLATAAAAVRDVGGEITHELGIIGGVGAQIPAKGLGDLRAHEGVRVFADRGVKVAGSKVGAASGNPSLIGANLAHASGITGKGITIAVLDTGFWGNSGTNTDTANASRILAGYNAITNTVGLKSNVNDGSGHGTHIFSTAADSNFTVANGVNLYNGVAPGASIVVVQAFDQNGAGTYANVIRGISWILANKATYKIRVLNCSFAAPAQSYYWDDPLNQAIMKAWQAGIVVVASAGNTGPKPMTIGVPGNVPYVVTVGAMTDSYTPANTSDDRLASFSAAGPTVEGFAKPDVVAPGGHVVALMDKNDTIPQAHPLFAVGASYFQMSGTSQAAGVVSGLAALVLQKNPSLTPNDVKCVIMGTARAFKNSSGAAAYTVFQQGAGVVSAYDAVNSGLSGCANGGLDVAKDLAGTQHYGGTAYRDLLGNYFLLDEVGGTGTFWSGAYSKTGGYPWSSGYPWSAGYPWSTGYPWSNGYPWSAGYPWSSGFPASAGTAAPASINFWVDQE